MNSRLRVIKSITSLVVLLIIGGSLIYSGWQNSQHKPQSQAAGPVDDTILKVVDGDTAEIQINGQKKTVRFIGMDTPEVVDPRKTVQCFGREASNRGHALLENQKVRLEYDDVSGEQDKYGRVLAYVWLADGSLYNERMIADGYAHEYTYQNQAYKYQARFKAAEAEAQTAQRGFWSPMSCNGDTKQAAQ